MARIAHIVLLLAAIVLFALPGTGVFAQERVEGKVVKTHLTACGVVPGKIGTCEGTLELEPQAGNRAERMTLQITRDTVLKKGEQKTFLFQLEGSSVTVTYIQEGGQKVAAAVVTKGSGR